MSDGAGIQSSWRRGLAFAAIVFAGETIFLLPFILPRLFRPLMLQQWQISNLELGAAMSTYGIVAAISYAFGGPLADRFDAKRLMVTALLATALTGTLMWGRPTPLRLSLAYACFGGTTILLFWSALVRATHDLGSRQSRAFAFGIVEAGRGAVAATLGMIATSSWLGTPATDGSQVNASQVNATQQPSVNILVTFAILTVIAAAVAIAIGLPRPSPPDAASPDRSPPDRSSPATTPVKQWDRRMMAQVCKNPSVWLQSVILLAAYNGWKCIDLFGVYLTDL
ncbi:MAG: MFS transporter, partial [Planctomycetota bacterium]